MEPLTVPDDDGYVVLRVKGTEEGQPPSERRVDLYELEEALRAAVARHADDRAALFAALKEHLAGLGLPEMSWRAAAKFAREVFARVEALRKKDQAQPNSKSPG